MTAPVYLVASDRGEGVTLTDVDGYRTTVAEACDLAEGLIGTRRGDANSAGGWRYVYESVEVYELRPDGVQYLASLSRVGGLPVLPNGVMFQCQDGCRRWFVVIRAASGVVSAHRINRTDGQATPQA